VLRPPIRAKLSSTLTHSVITNTKAARTSNRPNPSPTRNPPNSPAPAMTTAMKAPERSARRTLLRKNAWPWPAFSATGKSRRTDIDTDEFKADAAAITASTSTYCEYPCLERMRVNTGAEARPAMPGTAADKP